MMYIDNPDRWKRPPPKSAFLDFVREHFRPLAQVGATRLLVRKERSDLELYDSAFQTKASPGQQAPRILHLRLPDSPPLSDVASIELVDFERPEESASTSASTLDQRLVLLGERGRRPAALRERSGGFVECPGRAALFDAVVPAIRSQRLLGRAVF